MDDSKILYSVNSAARALEVSRTKIYQWMRDGTLHYVAIGADRRIPADELKRLAAEGTRDERRALV